MLERGDTRIVKAMVVRVDVVNNTCDLVTLDESRAPYVGVPWSTAYLSQVGTGIDYAPLPRSLCWLMTETSDLSTRGETVPAIIAWHAPNDINAIYGARRPKRMPGDLLLSTQGGAEIYLNGPTGDLQIGAGPGCATQHFHLSQLIRSISDEYELHTAGGQLRWESCGVGDDSDIIRFFLEIKKVKGDELGFVEISTLCSPDEGKVEFRIFPDGDSASRGTTQEGPNSGASFTWSVDTSGSVSWSAAGEITAEAYGAIDIVSYESARVRAPEITIKALPINAIPEELEGAPEVKITQEEITITAPKIIFKTEELKVISSEEENLLTTNTDDTIPCKKLITEDLLQWLRTHTHDGGGPAPGLPLNEVLTTSNTKAR